VLTWGGERQQIRIAGLNRTDSNPIRADKPLQAVHFDIFGACKIPSFTGHSDCVVLIDDCTRYSCVYTVNNKSNILKRFTTSYADTAIIRSKHQLCCFWQDNAWENFSHAAMKWMNDHDIKSESWTPHEPWQNGRAAVQCTLHRKRPFRMGHLFLGFLNCRYPLFN
jgi:hypothetical protein